MGQPSDETLARRAQSGDADAFAVLMGRYQRTVLTLAYRMLGDLQEAEEITQEVFIRVYRSLGSFALRARSSHGSTGSRSTAA